MRGLPGSLALVLQPSPSDQPAATTPDYCLKAALVTASPIFRQSILGSASVARFATGLLGLQLVVLGLVMAPY